MLGERQIYFKKLGWLLATGQRAMAASVNGVIVLLLFLFLRG